MSYQQMGIELTATQWAVIGSVLYALASEAIGRSKLKENTVIDVVMTVLGSKLKAANRGRTPKSTKRTQ